MKTKRLRISVSIIGVVVGVIFVILGIDLLFGISYSGWSPTSYETFGADFYTSMQNVGVDAVTAINSLGNLIDSCIGGFGGFSIAIGLTTICYFLQNLINIIEKKDSVNRFEMLKLYKDLLDSNVISQEEYEEKKRQLLHIE
ncbi:MAG: SHOCT domain-containing protein [Ruminococcaceae bacterium]|nr:SHOCT domain-containing protein [Oscillospiraceae bacterium]